MGVQGADLDGLGRLKTTFERQAGALRTLAGAADAGLATLSQLWVGPDAAQFQGRWQAVHRQALTAAVAALGEAAALVERNRRAQEVASGADGAGAGLGGGYPAGSPIAHDTGTPGGGAAPGPVMVQRSPADIFNEDYMNAFIGRRVQGENSPELNALLESVLADDGTDPARLRADLDRIADIRGVDRDTFRSQYATYQQLQARSVALGGAQDPIDLDRHGDFLGSTASLRYGSVVGDVYGIDPVFGALLNPTGGLVGGGNDAYNPGDNDAVGYHGIFHDAAGYLNNRQGIGPGYDYLGREITDTNDPKTGQLGGISWWVGNHPDLDVDLSEVSALTGAHPNPVVLGGVQALHYLGVEEVAGQRLTLIEGGADIGRGVSDLSHGDLSGLGDVAQGTGNIVVGTVDNTLDLAAKPYELAHDVGSAVADHVPDLSDPVRDLGRPFAPLSGLLG